MIDFDPNTQEALMSQDVAMKFLVWAVYYNGIDLKKNVSFKTTGKFADKDAERLDRLKDVLFKCFGAESVANASAQMRRAREMGERCPFSEQSLNDLFGAANS